MQRQVKREKVETLTQELKNASHLVLINIGSVTHQKLETLRKTLKKVNAQIRVAKNSLLRRSLKSTSYKDMFTEDAFQGPSALVTFLGEASEGLKNLYQFIKTEGAFFKQGLIEGVSYDQKGLVSLSQLPSKGELQARLVSLLRQPLRRLIYTIRFPQQRIVHHLKIMKTN